MFEPQRHFILPVINTQLQQLTCEESKPFKCFNIKTSYSFLFTRKFRQYLFSKGVIICQKKQLVGVFLSWEITTGELHIFTVTQELFSIRRDQVVRKRNSTSIRLQIFFKANLKILIKTVTVSICPKITYKINLTID